MKSVIFDLGGVVVQWDPESFSRDCLQNASEREAVLNGMLEHADWCRFDGGLLSKDALLQRFCGRTSVDRSRAEEVFELVMHSLKLIDATNELIYELKAAGVALYCISNMSREHYGFLRSKYTFFDCFDELVISSHVKMTKPDKEIYELAIQKFGIQPSESLFVDDREDNIVAAEASGLNVVHFKRSHECRKKIRDFVGME